MPFPLHSMAVFRLDNVNFWYKRLSWVQYFTTTHIQELPFSFINQQFDSTVNKQMSDHHSYWEIFNQMLGHSVAVKTKKIFVLWLNWRVAVWYQCCDFTIENDSDRQSLVRFCSQYLTTMNSMQEEQTAHIASQLDVLPLTLWQVTAQCKMQVCSWRKRSNGGGFNAYSGFLKITAGQKSVHKISLC